MTSITSNRITRGQLERKLSQRLQKIYRQQLGHSVSRISCQLFNDKLTVIVEDSLTRPEQLLLEEKQESKLVEQVHSDLDDVLRPSIVRVVEETLRKRVTDLISDTVLKTSRTGMIILLAAEP